MQEYGFTDIHPDRFAQLSIDPNNPQLHHNRSRAPSPATTSIHPDRLQRISLELELSPTPSLTQSTSQSSSSGDIHPDRLRRMSLDELRPSPSPSASPTQSQQSSQAIPTMHPDRLRQMALDVDATPSSTIKRKASTSHLDATPSKKRRERSSSSESSVMPRSSASSGYSSPSLSPPARRIAIPKKGALKRQASRSPIKQDVAESSGSKRMRFKGPTGGRGELRGYDGAGSVESHSRSSSCCDGLGSAYSPVVKEGAVILILIEDIYFEKRWEVMQCIDDLIFEYSRAAPESVAEEGREMGRLMLD